MIEGRRTWVQVGRGYSMSSQKGREGMQQTGADIRCTHRYAVRRCFQQTPHCLPRMIGALASVSARNAPSSVPSKHYTARVRATPPALSPSETLCLWKQHAHRIQIKTNKRRHTDACNTTMYLSFFSAFYFLF